MFPLRTPVASIVILSVTSLLLGAGGAVAGSLVTSAQIKDNTVKSRDIRDGTIRGRDVKDKSLTAADFSGDVTGLAGPSGADGTRGPVGPEGPQGIAGSSGSATAVVDTTGSASSAVTVGVFVVTGECRETPPPGGPAFQDLVYVSITGDDETKTPGRILANTAPAVQYNGPGQSILGTAIGYFADENSSRFTTEIIHPATGRAVTITAARWRDGATCQMIVNVSG